MQAIVFQECEWWVGQCIETDIAVQAKTFDGVKEAFAKQFEAYKEIAKQRALEGRSSKLPNPTPVPVIQALLGKEHALIDI